MKTHHAVVRLVTMLASATACSSSSGSSSPQGPDASAAAEDASALHDAEGARDATAPASCEGSCKVTLLVAKFGGVERTLDRAQFGLERSDAGEGALHVEAHRGGLPECPSQSSPSPDHTMTLSQVPRSIAAGSSPSGMTGAFFDFKGDLGLPPLVRAKSVTVSDLKTDPAATPAWTAFDVHVTFDEGIVSGHVYAAYCASLSD